MIAVPTAPPQGRMASADEFVRVGLAAACRSLSELGVPVPALRGKLLRPSFAVAMVPQERWAELDARFWSGALAVQMVHEASLLHDDVIDAATERRGEATLAARLGTGPAVVLGDHYLTGAYRAAVGTGSFAFLEQFTRAVERTVAGEVAQGSATGMVLTAAEYARIIEGKSGELFGAAAALGAHVTGLPDAPLREEVGRAFGGLYQRIDDLLDYCRHADTGKPPGQDYGQQKWSWVLGLAEVERFDLTPEELAEALFVPGRHGTSAARRALARLHAIKRTILRDAIRAGTDGVALQELLDACVQAAEDGVTREELALGAPPKPRAGTTVVGAHEVELRAREEAAVRARAGALGGPAGWSAYFGEHARTFRLAARLFPPREGGLITGLYAYCRFTDDLVDDPGEPVDPSTLTRRLAVWHELSLRAFSGEDTGIALLDHVLGTAGRLGVDRGYPIALLDGVAMDLRPRTYETWDDLATYTFGVAGAVGGWMTQLFGLRDADLLEQAHALGHAMQLTNIARDVGEDWARGRVYLPLELLHAHGLEPDDIGRLMSSDRGVPDAYRAAVVELLGRADAYYELAWPGIRKLPPFFRRPVAAAASAYRGIHREIRRNGYDNLTRRAHTSLGRRLVLAGSGVLEARTS